MLVELLGGSVAIDLTLVDVDGEELYRQLEQYEAGDRQTFDCEVTFPDTYTGRVLRAIATIPFGETRTYGELAADLGSAPRAIGGACSRNPVPLVVPCHRVVRADGDLGGYAAAGGIELKRRLLEHEHRHA